MQGKEKNSVPPIREWNPGENERNQKGQENSDEADER